MSLIRISDLFFSLVTSLVIDNIDPSLLWLPIATLPSKDTLLPLKFI